MFLRTVKVPSTTGNVNVYVRVVESYRENGKVKQRTIADLGRKDVLVALWPQLDRLLRGQPKLAEEPDLPVDILDALAWGPVLVVRQLFRQLGLWDILDRHLGQAKTASFTDRAFVLIANRLICPSSEHGLARWLETAFVCDRQGRRFVPHWHTNRRVKVHPRQLQAWYRTLDQLVAAKSAIEVDLYQRLRDLFSLRPDLVLFDITSTYFEGQGPENFAKHGYSRDGKRQNVQVIVGVVMVGGWPIAHYIWEGNRLDHTTVAEVLRDLMQRFAFARVIFVGDRGMVTEDNLTSLQEDGHGYLVGLKRRRNEELDGWLQQLRAERWVDCPMGINAQERAQPPRTRVQEVDTGDPNRRVFVIDSDERRAFEQQKRQQAMQRTQAKLLRLQERVALGRLVQPEKIGAAAERILQAHHGYRYFTWQIRHRAFVFAEHPVHLEREKRLEGKYVIATGEKNVTAVDAVALYKQLMDLERGFRHLKDVLALRPIYHQVEPRVRAHIFVAALALLVQRLLEYRLKDQGVDLSAPEALQAVQTISYVRFQVDRRERNGVSAASPRARQVLRALNITELRPPTPQNGDRKVV